MQRKNWAILKSHSLKISVLKRCGFSIRNMQVKAALMRRSEGPSSMFISLAAILVVSATPHMSFWYRNAAYFPILRNPSILDACDIDEKTKEMLLQDIRHRLMPQAVKLRADFEVSCFAYEGIDAVRRALHAGLALSTDDLPIKVSFNPQSEI